VSPDIDTARNRRFREFESFQWLLPDGPGLPEHPNAKAIQFKIAKDAPIR
jgi:hypothetical protein